MKNPLKKSDAWLNEYYGRVSGSTAAAAVGLSPYESRSSLALKMRDPKAREDLSMEPAIRRGVFGEEAALFVLQEAIGYPIERHDQEKFIYNPAYPHGHCLPDGWPDDGSCSKRIAEVKVVGWSMFCRIREHGLRQDHVVQALHNIALTDAVACDFGVLNFEHMVLHYETVNRNQEAIDALMAGEAEFFAKLQAGEEILDAEELSWDEETKEHVRIVSEQSACESAAKLIQLKDQYRSLESQIDSLVEDLQGIVGPTCERFIFDGVAAGTWKYSKPGRSFDVASALLEDPSLARFYKKNKAARPFVVRPLKGA